MILAHRLLKNASGKRRYVRVTEAAAEDTALP
jgi:hypothetical protein